MTRPCPFCGEPIDHLAGTCPRCGEPICESGISPRTVIAFCVGALVVGLLCMVGGLAVVLGPRLVAGSKRENEEAAISGLRAIEVAQALFREGDRDRDGRPDFGDLQELKDAMCVGAVLGSGTKDGYVFQVAVSPTSPESLWMATATPVAPGRTGDRYFMIDHQGVIDYSTIAPFAITPDCAAPAGALHLDR